MSAIVEIEAHTSTVLRQRLWKYGLFCLCLLAAGYFFLRTTWAPGEALRWLGLSALGTGYVLWRLWSALDENYRPGENRLLPDLGAGNIVTLVRGALIACMCGFLFNGQLQGWLAWLPGVLYTVAALLDGFDGVAARLSNHVTRLGETLDVSFDSLGVLVVTMLLAQYGKVPVWFVFLGLARYAFLGGMWLRHKFGLPVYDLVPSNSRRMIAGFTFGFTFALLWPILKPPGTLWAASFWAVWFLGAFFLDWLIVSGVLKQNYGASFSEFNRITTTWLPVLLRGAAVLLLGAGIISRLTNGPVVSYLNPWQFFLANQLFWLDGVVMLAMAFGIAVRNFSLAGLFLLGIHQNFLPLDLLQQALIYLYISLVFLGSGTFSLWRPEDRLIEHRIGEQDS